MAENGNGNGNGNGKSMWVPMSVCSAVLLTIGGSFGSAYVRDQNRTEARVAVLETALVQAAEERGSTRQTLAEIKSLAITNRDNIVASFKELDSKLQREQQLIEATLRTENVNLDKRLQGEIATVSAAIGDRITQTAGRTSAIEEWMRTTANNRWTKEDHQRFEDKLGLKLTKDQP